jgi:hypothetical protein
MDKQPIDKQQDREKPVTTDEDFESKLKGIKDDDKDVEDNKNFFP